MRQLALPFAYQPRFEREDLVAAPSNEAARAWLGRSGAPLWPERRLVLWGEAGCGKTHLLQLWARDQGALLLPGTAVRGLRGVSEAGSAAGFAVDDADMATDEVGLLHLLNAARERALPVLLAGRAPPARWAIQLPDLASRLRASGSVGVLRPEEELLQVVLLRLFVQRQLLVSPSLIAWLIRHLPRSMEAMRDAVCRLDQAALMSGGAVTRLLASSVLRDMLSGSVEEVEQGGGDLEAGRLDL